MTTQSPDRRIALVTAAAGGGVGSAVCRRLAARGCSVVATDAHPARTEKFAAELAAEFPHVRVLGLPLDTGDREAIDEVTSRAAEELGPVQILVNNASVDILGTFFDFSIEDWDRTVAANLTGPWYLTRKVMPQMRDAGGGVVVNIGSIANDLGGSGFEGAYAITKGALGTLSRAISRDGAKHGIRGVTVSPGPISDTRIILSNPHVLELPELASLSGTFPTADEVAAIVEFLTTDAARHIVGETINVNAGAHMSR